MAAKGESLWHQQMDCLSALPGLAYKKVSEGEAGTSPKSGRGILWNWYRCTSNVSMYHAAGGGEDTRAGVGLASAQRSLQALRLTQA